MANSNLTRTTIALDDAEAPVVTLRLNRPTARNAINRRMADELTAALAVLAKNDSLRAVILTGTGDQAFCAGADLRERQALPPEERSAHTRAIAAAAEALAALPVPTIAAVRGFALAGGSELALACDLRIAATDAVFGFPEVRIGIFPGAGGVIRLPRLIGDGAARDLLFTGRRVEADEALRLGLVERLVSPETLITTARNVAAAIAANAPLAVRALKQAVIASAGLPAAAAHPVVAALRAPLDQTDDYAEGLAAFGERRTPIFRGR